jgi:preprotein translocase subunit Sss1
MVSKQKGLNSHLLRIKINQYKRLFNIAKRVTKKEYKSVCCVFPTHI